MKIFISGAITNNPNYKEDFERGVQWAKAICDNPAIFNPADLREGFSDVDYMKIGFAAMECCDIVLFLKGWKNSKGARLEYEYAKYLGLACLFEQEGKHGSN